MLDGNFSTTATAAAASDIGRIICDVVERVERPKGCPEGTLSGVGEVNVGHYFWV